MELGLELQLALRKVGIGPVEVSDHYVQTPMPLTCGRMPGRAYNWYSYETQLESVHKLLDWEWLHVFPGHGRQAHLKDASDRLKQITELLQAEGYQS